MTVDQIKKKREKILLKLLLTLQLLTQVLDDKSCFNLMPKYIAAESRTEKHLKI